MGLFAPSLQRASDLPASPISKAAGDYNSSRQHHNQRPASGLSSNLRTLSNVLLTGLSLAGLYDWFGASSSSALFTPMVTTFARRKKPYDPSETFVDTPASLAAMASAKQLAPGITQQQQPMGQAPTSKQPPTPCPSVEEYISPTFARNYQGAWKYVVQIPHEGYFTQTIQRSSCVRQKCEFTEGVCHEAPRWVSLLVAEIYYPHAIFGASAAPGQQQQQSTDMLNQRVAFDGSQQQQLNQLMATAPSTSQIQQVAFASAMASGLQGQPHQAKSLSSANHHQDPMQMTDSLNNYSHNLNSAFNLALELGLNPMNVAQMEQLASVHNQQLMQRNGLAQTNQHRQQAQAESRVGTSAHPTQQRITSNNQVTKLATNNNQQQQQQQQYTQTVAQMPHLDQNQVLSNDYIRALAFEAIRQNPNLSIDELIKSIETQSAVGARRRKRDLTGVASNQQQQHSQSMSALQYSQRLPSPMAQQQPIESLASLNELGGLAAGAAHMSQQHAYEFGLSSPASPMQAPQQQQQQPQQTNRFQPQQPQVSNQINANNQQQIRSSQVDHQQMLASQSTLAHEVATAANQQAQQQHVASNPQAQQQSADPITQTSASQTSGNGNQASVAADNQVECDGHDKIGCYVVRVYYDWFLVNGSCKCWKTSTAANQQAAQGGSSSSSSSSASGSFIRRIFTG